MPSVDVQRDDGRELTRGEGCDSLGEDACPRRGRHRSVRLDTKLQSVIATTMREPSGSTTRYSKLVGRRLEEECVCINTGVLASS